MKNVTPIEGLVDIDSIPNEINPNMPINPVFQDQINYENNIRHEKNGPIKNKLVQHDTNWRSAVNGGSLNFKNENYDIQMHTPLQQYYGKQIEPLAYQQQYLPNQISCLDIADHVSNCPICTRFYAPEDRTHLYFIILTLGIICFVLFRKLMDVK